jgi:uncharacterized protein (TIGR03067 family)
MRLRTTFALAAGLVLAAEAPTDDAAKKDLEKFQGTWTTVRVEENGEKVPEGELRGLTLTVEGDKRTVRQRGKVLARGTFKLDASESPKQIDITLEAGDAKGRTFRGIYELEGDWQKVCLALEGGERPKEFSAKAGSGHLLQVFKRAKK